MTEVWKKGLRRGPVLDVERLLRLRSPAKAVVS
jgi:hypothetical protein